MPHRDIVCIGASAGGFGVLRQIARDLPDALDAAVFVVLHTGSGSPQMLADLLAHEGPLPAGYPAVDVLFRSRSILAREPVVSS